jgi:predicted transposase YdaD
MRLSALYIEKIQEAQQVGEARGRQEGKLELIMMQLREIVGDVPSELNDRITLLSLDKLPELAKALLRFSSIDDLVLWLTNNQ